MRIGIATNTTLACTAALDNQAARQIINASATHAALLDMLEANPPL